MQLNALSLIGFYGKEVKEKSSKILISELYDFICTDAIIHISQKTKRNLPKKKELIIWNGIEIKLH